MTDVSLPAAENESTLQDLRDRLNSATCELGLVRSGDVTKYTAALNSLPTFQIEALLKVTDPEKSSNPNVSHILASISEPDRVSFVRSKSSLALQRAIVLAFVGVLYLKHGSRDKGSVVNALGKLLRHKWHVDTTNSNLEDAIYYFRKAVEVEPSDAEGLDLSLEDLACTILEKFKITRSITDFEETRNAFERAISLGRDGTPFYMSSLGIVWKEHAGIAEEGKDALLDTSIDTHLKALNLLSLNPSIMTSGQIQYLHRNLAESYFERYELSTMDPAGTLHDSVKSAMANSTYRWMLLYELAVLHSRRYSLQGNHADAEISVALFRSALEDQPNNSMILRPLGAILHQSGIINVSPHNMLEGINVLEAVVAVTPENDPRLPTSLKSLSHAFLARFKRAGDLEDLDKAITAIERALSHPSLDEATRWEYLRVLGDGLLRRFETRNQPSDLAAASMHIQSALNATTLASHSKALCLYSYGCVLKIRSVFEPGLLEEAIESFKASLGLLATDQYQLRAECYNNLGNTFTTKFQKTGSRDDLHQAIDFYLQAIAVDDQGTDSTSKRRKLMYLLGLGNAHVTEYQKWRRAASIDLAISCYQEVVDGTDDDDQLFITRTGSLCFALGLKFEINKDEKLLKRAQNSLVAILNRPKPLTAIQTPFIQTRLGAIFYQYGLNGLGSEAVAYFDQAADWFQRSLESSSGDFEGMRNASANLINVLVLRYKVTQADDDLLAVLELMSRIRAQDATLLFSFAALHGLGQLFSNLLENQKFASLLAECGDMAILIFSLLSNESKFPSPPNLQAGSALMAASLSFELHKNARDASRFLTNATELLSQAITVGPNRSDHLRAIKELHTIPALTLSMFLEAGEPILKALQMCERGRCLVLDRLIDQKSDISNLAVSHPELAVKFEDLRERLAQNNTSKQVINDLKASSLQNMNDCVFEYKQTLASIRQQPGFENFLLLPEDVANILDYGVSGNIVLLNASKYRSDAILITSGGISHLPLSGVYDPTGQHLEDLAGLTSDTKDFNNLMKWLWAVIARPVLDELGHTGVKHDGSLPRVWWMTSGWISPLHIHAAGDHAKAKETGEPCTVLDRVISSYIPTLKMLKFARNKRKSLPNSQHDMKSDLTRDNEALIVQMPVTPNNTDLLHVGRECELIEKHLQKDLHVTSRSCPKRNDILASLKSASMAHFACHGVVNTEDPSLSRLLLQDWRSAPFDVRFILGMSTQCQFVYLSGCQTGSAANARYLSTESIHISSAFLTAGVPYVVATLVDIDDEISVTIADRFYSYLIEKNMDFSRSAEALHAAQVYARDSGIDPFQWLAFAHFGA